MKQVTVLNVPVTTEPQTKILQHLANDLKTGKQCRLVFTPNPEQVMLAQQNPAFLLALQQADIWLPDGVGLVWAVRRLQGIQIKRIAGVDFAEQLLRQAVKHQLKVYLLGAQLTKNQQKQLQRKLQALGLDQKQFRYDSGPSQIDKVSLDENKQLLERIKSFKADIVLVAFGAPYQEMWTVKQRDQLTKAGVKVAMVVGGAFDMWAGKVRRSPEVLQRSNLEWLWRLVQEPRRLKRQLKLIEFVRLVLKRR